MKYFLLMQSIMWSLTGAAIGQSTFAFSENVQTVGKNYRSYTIHLSDGKHDAFLQKMMNVLGTPSIRHGAGVYVWNNLAIDNVGDNLTLRIQDGILRVPPTGWPDFKTFSTDSAKIHAISKMQANIDFRILKIIIGNDQEDNMINTEVKLQAAKSYLKKISN